jgi:hypothetical protein
VTGALSGQGAVLLIGKDNLCDVKMIVHLLKGTLYAVKDFVWKDGLSLPSSFEPSLPLENKGQRENQQEDLDSKQDRQIDMQSVHHAHR